LVSRQRLSGFSAALICLSYSGVLAHGHHWRPAKIGLPSHSSAERNEGWLSRAVTLRGLPVISRVLCY
jgi:hypothetical protein